MDSKAVQAEIKRLRQELESSGWSIEIVRNNEDSHQPSQENTYDEMEENGTWVN